MSDATALQDRTACSAIPNHLLVYLLQPERRIHLQETLHEMAVTSAAHYFIIGCTAVLAVLLFPVEQDFNQQIALAAASIAVLAGILFFVYRHRLPLVIAVFHTLLAMILVSAGLVASNIPEVAVSVSMMFVLTALHAFHFFSLTVGLCIVALIGLCFFLTVGIYPSFNWCFTLTLLTGCCLTAGVVVNLMVRRLNRLATTDKLTGAYNRHTWDALLERKLECARRLNRPLTLMIIDLDKFKKINDTLGHQEGDRVLQVTAENIRGILGPSDVAARWGGDEFIVLLDNCTRSEAEQTGERLKKALRGTISFTSGIAEFKQHDTSDTLLSRADKQLLQKRRLRKKRTTDMDIPSR